MTKVIEAIVNAENLITNNGGVISQNAEIIYNGNDEEVLEAINFLVEQCSYELKK